MVVLLRHLSMPSKVILLRSRLRASEMTSWVGSTLQTLKSKGNVSYNYYYSEKSFTKWLGHEPSHLRRWVQYSWVGAARIVFLSLWEHTSGACPPWKMTWSVNVNNSEIFLKGILAWVRGSVRIPWYLRQTLMSCPTVGLSLWPYISRSASQWWAKTSYRVLICPSV